MNFTQKLAKKNKKIAYFKAFFLPDGTKELLYFIALKQNCQNS